MDATTAPHVRPLPVGPGTAVLLGTSRWMLHLFWSIPIPLVLAVLAGLASEWTGELVLGRDHPAGTGLRIPAQELDTLARRLVIVCLLVPLPSLLVHLLLKLCGIGALRRVAARTCPEARPTAAERHALAYSPSSRIAAVARILVWGLVGLTVLCALVPVTTRGAPAAYWIPAVVSAVLTAVAVLARKVARRARSAADRDWERTREQWPHTGTTPRAYSMAEDDGPMGHSQLSGLTGFVGFLAIGGVVWALVLHDEGDGIHAVVGSLTPLHLSGIAVLVMLALFVLELVIHLVRASGTYHSFARDPRAAAQGRVRRKKDPDVPTSVARAAMRRHPLTIPAVSLTVLGAGLVELTAALAPTGEAGDGIRWLLPWVAVPGVVLVLIGLAMSIGAAHGLAVHRRALYDSFPRLDPVVARIERMTDSDGARQLRTFVVYGDRTGDEHVFARDTNDDPR